MCQDDLKVAWQASPSSLFARIYEGGREEGLVCQTNLEGAQLSINMDESE